MKFTRISLKANHGFGLIELISTLAITSIVMVGITALIFQLVSQREHTQDSMLASEKIRSAYHWLNRDLLVSQAIEVGDDTGTAENEAVSLLWVGSRRLDAQDNEHADLYEVRYVFENNELHRYLTLTTSVYDADGTLIDTQTSNTTLLVAQDITDLVISSGGTAVNVSITATVDDIENTKSFEVEPRVEASL